MDRLPEQTIARLPIYLRCLTQARSIGMRLVNSLGIAQMAGTNAAQVRKDLSYLGELGTRGVGYDVAALAEHISEVLGLETPRRVAIVGFGRLGRALAVYPGFAEHGFHFVAAFDADPAAVRALQGDDALDVHPIENLETALVTLGVEIVLLTTPAQVAQEMASRVAAGGVRAILNFAPVVLELPDGVKVRPVDLASELQVLSFHLARMS